MDLTPLTDARVAPQLLRWGREILFLDEVPKFDKFKSMTIKEHALQTIQNLPEDADWEEVKDRIEFRSAVEKGLRELDQGKGIPVEDLEKELKDWISK